MDIYCLGSQFSTSCTDNAKYYFQGPTVCSVPWLFQLSLILRMWLSIKRYIYTFNRHCASQNLTGYAFSARATHRHPQNSHRGFHGPRDWTTSLRGDCGTAAPGRGECWQGETNTLEVLTGEPQSHYPPASTRKCPTSYSRCSDAMSVAAWSVWFGPIFTSPTCPLRGLPGIPGILINVLFSLIVPCLPLFPGPTSTDANDQRI